MENTSATAIIRQLLPKILQEKEYKNGITAKKLWTRLEKEDNLKTQLYDKKGKKRLGIIAGLTTRVKNNKVANIKLVNKDGQNVFIYYNNDLEYLISLTKNYIEQVQNLDLKAFSKELSLKDKNIFTDLKSNLASLEANHKFLTNLNKKIISKQILSLSDDKKS